MCVEYTPLVLLKQYEGVLSQVSKKEKKEEIYLENGSVILNLATKHTQLTAYLEIGRGGGGGRTTRGDGGADEGEGGTARVHTSGCVFLCGVSVCVPADV